MIDTGIQTIDNLECIMPICKDIISMYCKDNDIDEKNIHPVIWGDILDDICVKLISPNRRLLKPIDCRYNEYDDDKVLYIYKIYTKLCRKYIQEICLKGFTTFSGIEKQTILNWSGDKLSTPRFDLHQKIVEDNEQSLSDMMLGDRGIPTKYLAKLNRYHGWNLPGVSRETTKDRVLTAAELPKLDSITDTEMGYNALDVVDDCG